MTRFHALAALIVTALVSSCTTGATQTPAGTESASVAAQASGPAATATDEPTASLTEEPTASATPIAEVEHEFDWTVAFTITAPADWKAAGTTESVALESGLDVTADLRTVMSVFLKAGDTPEKVVDRLAGIAALDVTEPEPTDIGGAPGYMVDIQANEQAPVCSFGQPCVQIHVEPGEGWYWAAVEGRPMRVWAVDVDGQTVMIVSDSREDRFETWISQVEEYLGTLEWQE